MFENKKCIIVAIFVVVINILQCYSLKLSFGACGQSGWKCNNKTHPNLIEYGCLNKEGVNFELWKFDASTKVQHLRIENCSSVEIDLTCGSIGSALEGIHIRNVNVLMFTNLVHKQYAQMPETVHIEDVQSLPLIPGKTFKQMKYPLASAYNCTLNHKPLNTVTFSNVNIGTVQKYAFYNLTNVEIFRWFNVSVETMEPRAIHVDMKHNTLFEVSNSSFNQLGVKAFTLHCPRIFFQANSFKTIPQYAINAVSFDFNFNNNQVNTINPYAYSILSQNVTIRNNTINSVKSNALRGIGPGLLKNAMISFNNLKFYYNFNYNTIRYSDLGGLYPDFASYKRVRSNISVTPNILPLPYNSVDENTSNTIDECESLYLKDEILKDLEDFEQFTNESKFNLLTSNNSRMLYFKVYGKIMIMDP